MIWQGWLRLVSPLITGTRGVFGHLQQRRLLEGADHDQVDIARQHAGGVGDGLAVAELHLARPTAPCVCAAHLAHADVEADPGAGRGLLEDQRDHAARPAAGRRRARPRAAVRGRSSSPRPGRSWRAGRRGRWCGCRGNAASWLSLPRPGALPPDPRDISDRRLRPCVSSAAAARSRRPRPRRSRRR